MKKIFVLLLCLCSMASFAQKKEKIRGNKDVIVTQTALEDFSVLEIGEDHKVTLVKGKEAMIEIETDENLQEVFQKEVRNDTFYLTTNKDIRRSKKMRIRITFTESLTKVIVKENAEIDGLTTLTVDGLEVETRNSAAVYATITADFFTLKNNDKAKVELNLTAKEAKFQLNQSSNIKALVNAEIFNADIYESAEARIEGDVKNFTLRADNSSKFNGQKLTAETATVLSEGRSENSIMATKDLEISATGYSKLNIYGTPNMELTKFTDEAMLIKKR